MKKYIAFGLYQKNEQGGHVAARSILTGGDEVYLATDVVGLLRAIKRELDDDDLAVARRMVNTALMVSATK